MPTNIQTRTCALCERDEESVSFPDWSNHPDETIACDPTPLCESCGSIPEMECEACGTRGYANVMNAYNIRWRAANALRNIRFRIVHPDLASQGQTLMQLSYEDATIINRYADERSQNLPLHMREFWNIPPNANIILQTDDDCTRCEDCVHSCDECGVTIGSTYSNENYDCVCYSCSLYTCTECHERYESEYDADSCCDNGEINSYCYRPAFFFWRTDENGTPIASGVAPKNELFLGVELETECGKEYWSDFLMNANETFGAEKFCYGKEDGSLDESGVELVTMPSTLDAFMQRFPWDALRRWNANGARSYWRSSCGMHIHVSRSFFTPTHMWRFVAFQLRNQSLCARIGQRESSTYAEWQTLGEFGKYGTANLSAIVKGERANGARYVAINFQNDETIELRYFRGNLRTDVIRARVEFVHALAYFTQGLSARDVINGALSEIEFAAFVFARRDRYANLANWFLANPKNGEDA